MNSLIVLSLVVSLLGVWVSGAGLAPLPRFAPDASAFGPWPDGTAAAAGDSLGTVQQLLDWNNDRHNDLLCLARNGTAIGVWLWDAEANVFVAPRNSTGTWIDFRSAVGLAAADMVAASYLLSADTNRDGFVDVMLAVYSPSLQIHQLLRLQPSSASQGTRPQLVATALPPGGRFAADLNLHVLPGTPCGVPVLTTVNANGDFVAFVSDQAFPGGATPVDCVYPANDAVPNYNFGTPRIVIAAAARDPTQAMFSGQADFDGTCVSRSFTYSGGTMLIGSALEASAARTVRVPSTASPPSIVDFDADGYLDLFFSVCVDSRGMPSSDPAVDCPLAASPLGFGANALLVLVNQDAADSTAAVCSPSAAESSWGFPNATRADWGVDGTPPAGVTVLRLDGTLWTNASTPPPTPAPGDESSCSPAALLSTAYAPLQGPQATTGRAGIGRVGDYNLDRIADFLLPTTLGPVLLSSSEGVPGRYSCTRLAAYDASLDAATAGDRVGASSRALPFFFDISDDGVWDIIVWDSLGLSSQPLSVLRSSFLPNVRYFFTTVALDGAAGSDPSAGTWGSALLGTTHRLSWKGVDINADPFFAANTQYAFSQLLALPSPRSHFGLSTTFSSIDTYSVGTNAAAGAYAVSNTSWLSSTSGSRQAASRRFTTFVIPNSQVVVTCFPLNDPSQWSMQLLLPVNRMFTLVLAVLGGCLAALGVPILVMWAREVREDRREHKNALH